MTTYLGKSCSFCLPRVPFVNCRQFMYLVSSLFGSECRIWDLIVSVPDHCLSFYSTKCIYLSVLIIPIILDLLLAILSMWQFHLSIRYSTLDLGVCDCLHIPLAYSQTQDEDKCIYSLA